MQKRKKRPLSAKRPLHVSNMRMEKSVHDFFLGGIHLDAQQTGVEVKKRRRNRAVSRGENRSNTIEVRDGWEAQRRAFEIEHAKREKILLDAEKRRWARSERYRLWRNSHLRGREIVHMSPDMRVTERIIDSRNDYYTATLRNVPPPAVQWSHFVARERPDQITFDPDERTRLSVTPGYEDPTTTCFQK
jgi:hypothetical protein